MRQFSLASSVTAEVATGIDNRLVTTDLHTHTQCRSGNYSCAAASLFAVPVTVLSALLGDFSGPALPELKSLKAETTLIISN